MSQKQNSTKPVCDLVMTGMTNLSDALSRGNTSLARIRAMELSGHLRDLTDLIEAGAEIEKMGYEAPKPVRKKATNKKGKI